MKITDRMLSCIAVLSLKVSGDAYRGWSWEFSSYKFSLCFKTNQLFKRLNQ